MLSPPLLKTCSLCVYKWGGQRGEGWIWSWTPRGILTWRQDTTAIDSGSLIASEWCGRIVQNWSVSDLLDRSHCSTRLVSAVWALVPWCELQLLSLQEPKCAGPGYLMGVTNPAQFTTLGCSSPGKAPLGAGRSKRMHVHGSKLLHAPLTPHCLLPVTIHGRWCSFSATFPIWSGKGAPRRLQQLQPRLPALAASHWALTRS